jgi:hypothetical protein
MDRPRPDSGEGTAPGHLDQDQKRRSDPLQKHRPLRGAGRLSRRQHERGGIRLDMWRLVFHPGISIREGFIL